MGPTLYSGDYILVNKTIPGARLFDIFIAIKGEEPAIYRMPGWHKIVRNDVVVFNYPYPRQEDSIHMDIMSYYVKRCIGLPGDSISIKNGFYQIAGVKESLGNRDGQSRQQERLIQETPQPTYPNDTVLNWNIMTFGPLYIPAKGDSIPMTRTHFLLYRKLIEWEQKKPLTIDAQGNIYLGNRMMKGYLFRHNYYFMAGDHVEASLDSRYWGLVPEAYIVGKAWLIWKSVNTNTGKMRKERFFMKIQ